MRGAWIKMSETTYHLHNLLVILVFALVSSSFLSVQQPLLIYRSVCFLWSCLIWRWPPSFSFSLYSPSEVAQLRQVLLCSHRYLIGISSWQANQRGQEHGIIPFPLVTEWNGSCRWMSVFPWRPYEFLFPWWYESSLISQWSRTRERPRDTK